VTIVISRDSSLHVSCESWKKHSKIEVVASKEEEEEEDF
jgi:hypothetical protein